MCWTCDHLKWLEPIDQSLKTVDGIPVFVFQFRCTYDDTVMSKWAKHFRNHYCLDSEINEMIIGTKYTKKDYLNQIKFPDKNRGLGPSVRAGDFGEILVADFLQFNLGYWVPRLRYANKTVRLESGKGSDILGFYFHEEGKESLKDRLAIFEVKAQFSSPQSKSRLQDAIDDSAKDQIRKAESLNALRQILFNKNRLDDCKKVARFQNPEDKPYFEINGASALISTNLYNEKSLMSTDAQNHPNKNNLYLLVIRGDNFMDLVHELYKRAADEA